MSQKALEMIIFSGIFMFGFWIFTGYLFGDDKDLEVKKGIYRHKTSGKQIRVLVVSKTSAFVLDEDGTYYLPLAVLRDYDFVDVKKEFLNE